MSEAVVKRSIALARVRRKGVCGLSRLNGSCHKQTQTRAMEKQSTEKRNMENTHTKSGSFERGRGRGERERDRETPHISLKWRDVVERGIDRSINRYIVRGPGIACACVVV